MMCGNFHLPEVVYSYSCFVYLQWNPWIRWEVIWSDPPNTGTSRSNQPDDLQTDEVNGGIRSGALATADDELEEEDEEGELDREAACYG